MGWFAREAGRTQGLRNMTYALWLSENPDAARRIREQAIEDRNAEYLLELMDEEDRARREFEREYGDGNPEGDPTRNGAW